MAGAGGLVCSCGPAGSLRTLLGTVLSSIWAFKEWVSLAACCRSADPRSAGARTLIESRYWRDELKADIRWLRAKQRYKRWSEKQMVLFERKLMLVAFQVRALLERPKVNDSVRALKLDGVRYAKVGNKPFTVVGPGWLEDHFDLSSPEAVQLPVWDLCNQLIHYYVMFAVGNGRGRFSSVLVFSDYKRHTCMYEFEVGGLIDFFSAFSADVSAVCSCRFVWNEKKQDYVMEESRGASDGVQRIGKKRQEKGTQLKARKGDAGKKRGRS
jgi:hypothetical protein